MRFTNVVVTLATAGSLVASQPHKHHQRHANKRSPGTKIVDVAGPTVTMYELNGQLIPQSEVCSGIKAGTLKWAQGTNDPPPCDTNDNTPTSTFVVSTTLAPSSSTSSISIPTTTVAAAKENVQQAVASPSSTTSTVVAVSSAVASSSSPAATSSSTPSSGSSSYDSQIATGQGLDTEFPDGELDCSTFPSDYGAIPVDWQGIGGWSGIQYVTITGNSVTHINNAVPNQGFAYCAAQDGNPAMCSYACPPGYQKSQWPSTQGANGESIGGIMCGTDGKLHLTNSGLSKNLCIQGTGKVTVKNTLSENAPICRTDYPGIEGETVPLDTQAGSISPLTCPDESSYYQHLNSPTSAEYYVNMKGTPVSAACNWSSDGSYEGNWAPVVFGVGTNAAGETWLSIMTTQQNLPTSYKPLDYTVELTGDFGGDNACFLTQDTSGNALYCTKGTPNSYNPSDCTSSPGTAVPGCTVQLLSGTATYVLS